MPMLGLSRVQYSPALSPSPGATKAAGHASNLVASLCVPPDEPLLAGHFPGEPVVPGVWLLEAVRSAFEQTFGAAVDTVAVEHVRFHQPLLPDSTAQLTASVVRDGEQFVVDGEFTAGERRLATFCLRLSPRSSSR